MTTISLLPMLISSVIAQQTQPVIRYGIDYYGDARAINDRDDDGWDDLWILLNYGLGGSYLERANLELDRNIDTDDDGLTDYQEMLWNRCPWVKGPIPPRWRPPTTAEKLAAQKMEEEAQRQKEVIWAQRKRALERSKGDAPADQDEAQRLRDETARQFVEKLNRDHKQTPWIPNSDSVAQIEHSNAAIVQHKAGSNGATYYGAGQVVAVCEVDDLRPTPPSVGGPIHPDMTGHLSSSYSDPSPNPSSHASNVAGVIVGSGLGNASARGIASQATAVIHNSLNGDLVSRLARWDKIKAYDFSNHSYGMPAWTGQEPWPQGATATENYYYYFNSRPDVSRDEPNYFGQYTVDAAFIDAVKNSAPDQLYVQAAGNYRIFGFDQDYPDRQNADQIPHPPPARFAAHDSNGEWYLDSSGFYPYGAGHADNGNDSLPPMACAKNALVVGGLDAKNAGSPSSGWGPTDDGRIKPDMVALGTDIIVPNSTDVDHGYVTSSGTSLAAPLVTGAATLLAESRAKRKPGQKFKGATLKALLMATAQDIGVQGPDPKTGFGNLQASWALFVARTDDNSNNVKEVTIKPGGDPVAFQVEALPGPKAGLTPNNMRLKVFICWDDPGFEPNDATLNLLDSPVKTLVNDLDLVVTHVVTPADTDPYEPVEINLGTGAKTFAANHKDNVECVEVYDEGIFNIEVKYTGTLTGPQPVSIIIQGANPEFKQTSPASTTPPAPGVNPASPKSTVINQTGANEYTLTWPSVCGRVYDIESSPDLVTWTPVVYEVKANGFYTSYPVARLSGDRGFYRIKDVNDPEILDPVELAPIEGIEEE